LNRHRQCTHCKNIAADWEKLAELWDGHEVGLIAEVDCTGEGRMICDEHGIRSTPTLGWGDPTANRLTEYHHYDTDFKTLDKYATENLRRVCSPANIDLCDDERKSFIERFMNLSDELLDEMVESEESDIKKAEAEYDEAVSRLQAEHAKLQAEKEFKLQEIRNTHLGLLKSVKAHIEKLAAKDEL
jgi:hypothetical protein